MQRAEPTTSSEVRGRVGRVGVNEGSHCVLVPYFTVDIFRVVMGLMNQ